MRGAKTMGLSPFINLFSFSSICFLCRKWVKRKSLKVTKRCFKINWFDNPQFKPWLSRVKNEKHKFQCNVCQRVLQLWTSGQYALTDHAKRKKYIDSLERRNSFFKNAKVKKVTTEVGESSYVSNVNPPGQQTLEECIGGCDSIKNEIVWILNSVVCGLSARKVIIWAMFLLWSSLTAKLQNISPQVEQNMDTV